MCLCYLFDKHSDKLFWHHSILRKNIIIFIIHSSISKIQSYSERRCFFTFSIEEIYKHSFRFITMVSKHQHYRSFIRLLYRMTEANYCELAILVIETGPVHSHFCICQTSYCIDCPHLSLSLKIKRIRCGGSAAY